VSEQTRATVEKFYDLLGAGDTSTAIGLLAEDFHWEIPGDVDTVPWLGRRTTTRAVGEFFAQMGNHVDRKAFDIARIVVDGPNAVVLGRAAVVVRSTGKLIDTQFAIHFVVDSDGRISRFVMFEDSWHVAEAMRP
jgi:ketosteroid isomerase-like protein